MKQTLNEEISRIKSIMGCCKGKINEDESNCVDLESEKGQQLINSLASNINDLGLTNDDISYEGESSPEIDDTKKKVVEMINPVLKSGHDINQMIKDVRDLRRKRRHEKQNATKPQETQPVNEQGESLWASKVMPFLASIPTGTWIIIGAWLILRLLRCKIYEFELSLMRCANGGQRNIIVKLTELIMLDFRNFFEFDDNLWNCGSDDDY